MAGFRIWTDDDRLTPDDLNGYLMGQVIARFPSAAERDAQMTGVPGMVSYLADTGLQICDRGGVWVSVTFPAYTLLPDASSVPAGSTVYNKSTNTPQWSDGTAWHDFGSGSGGGSGGDVQDQIDGKVSKTGDEMSGSLFIATGGLDLNDAGIRLLHPGAGLGYVEDSYLPDGSGKQGVAVLVGGTVVVATRGLLTSSRIWLTAQNLATVAVPSALAVSAQDFSADVPSFTILASDPADTSSVAWQITDSI